MRSRESHAREAMIVPTVPPCTPVLHAEDLPGDDDWAVLATFRIDRDDTFEHELRHDRFGSLTLAPAAFD